MTTYYVAFKPYAELVGVGKDGSVIRQGGMALSRPLVYNCGSLEADLSGIASTLSREVQRMGADVTRCLTSRTSTAFFLLTSSGLVVYLLFRSRGGKDSPDPLSGSASPMPLEDVAKRGIFDQLRSWLQWLFQEEEEEDDEVLTRQGRHRRYHHHHHHQHRSSLHPPSSVSRKTTHTPSGAGNGRNGARSPAQSLYIAPCPNCLKGVCKIRKHLVQQRQQCLSVPSPATAMQNDSGSNASSPIKPLRGSQTHSPVSATPYNADDEHSDLELEDEDESSLPFINLPPPAPAPSQRSGLSSRSNHRGSKPRVPPEGLEGLTPGDTPTPPPPTSTGDSLSCGDASCKDPFCLQQRHMLREESTDSILTDHSVSGSMADLVKGAREIRRLIRETSMDSVASDFSLRFSSCSEAEQLYGLSNTTTCDEYEGPALVYHTVPPPNSKAETSPAAAGTSVPRPRVTVTPETSLDGSSPDLRVLRRASEEVNDPVTAQKKMRKLWRISAPLSDVELSPHHLRQRGGGGMSSTTATEATDDDSMSNWEWESPNHGWHGVTKPGSRRHHNHPVVKKNVSRSSSYLSDTGSNLDCWEWDSEGLSHDHLGAGPINSTGLAGHETWLPSDYSNAELDLETELAMSQAGSLSSRRDSFSSDMSIRHQVRLPPSGRSSVAKGHSPSVMTPSTSMDKEMLSLSLSGAAGPGGLPPPPSAWDPGYILSKFQGLRRSSSGSSIGSNFSASGTHPASTNSATHHNKPKKGHSKRTGAAMNSSLHSHSDESGVMVDLESSFESNQSSCGGAGVGSSGSVGSSTTFSAVTTPLSPVKEVREPRSLLNSPTADENLTILSPVPSNAAVRRNGTINNNPVRKNLAEAIESQLPDLEVVSIPSTPVQ